MRLQALIFLLLSGGLEGRHLSKRRDSNRKPRDVTYLTGADIPVTGFRCGAQEFAGIYADTETGCQVFHFCESNGRNASFFCPQLTLFNQQFFVCDWAYNVQCGKSAEFYSLNRDIYITPETVLSLVSAPVRPLAQLTGRTAQPTATALLAQPSDTDIKGSASEVSRTLSNLVSQLDSGSSSLVQDTSLGASQPIGYRQGSDPSIISGSGPGTVPEGGSRSGSPSTTSPASVPAAAASLTYTAAPVQTTPAPVYTTPTPGYTATTPSTESATVTPSQAYTAASSVASYNSAAYDDAADPEPVYYDSADPEPAGYYTNGLQGYDPSAAGSSYDSASSSYDSASSSYDSTSYSQPADDGSYNQVALAAQNLYDPYDSADPEPASYYDAADPEPASYYADTVDLSYTPGSDSSVAAAPASGYSAQVYDDAADPEPDQYYAQQIDLVGSQPTLDQRSSNSQGYSLFNTVNTITDFYNGLNSNGLVVDSADPEPDPEFTPYN